MNVVSFFDSGTTKAERPIATSSQIASYIVGIGSVTTIRIVVTDAETLSLPNPAVIF